MTDWTILAAVFWDYAFQTIFMAVLLCLSAFFSGSETAFFNLSRQTIRRLSVSSHRLERLVPRILRDPNRFLTALLFGNMAVNILYFAVSSTLLLKVGRSYGHLTGTVCGILCFIFLLFFSEMLPKSVAYSNSRRFCLLACPLCYFLLALLRPVVQILDWVVIQPAIRLFVSPKAGGSLSMNQIKSLLDSSHQQGLISEDQNQFLSEVLKFSYLKVRHVMLPRVQMPACSIKTSPREVMHEMVSQKLNKIPIFTKDIDHVVGIIYLRDILLNPDRPLDSLIRRIHFVPEQKSVESLIEFFKQSGTDFVIVVDEYGGVAGQVELEDIIEQLLGPLDVPEIKPIEQIGPLQYRLHANLSISDWAETFGLDLAAGRFMTIGGFVTALLEKNPQQGDSVVFKNIRFTVESAQNNRIISILLSLEPLANYSEGSDQ